MLLSPRLVVAFALAAGINIVACAPPPPLPLALPTGLPLEQLSDEQRALLRVSLAIDDGLLSETNVVLDPKTLALSGELSLNNVGANGTHRAALRVYGRVDADAAETLFGEAFADVAVDKNAAAFLDFSDSAFESCGAGIDGACGLRFDDNRNGVSNVDDVVAGVDAAPPAAFVATAPQFLQFSSGIRAGAFARQVVVVENSGAAALRIERVQVIGGQGVGVSVVDLVSADTAPPRRLLDGALGGALDKDGDGESDFVIAPGDTAFVAVSFAPVNGFLASAAVQIVARDVVSGVRQSTRTVVVANADGALRPRDPGYVEPDLTAVDLGSGDVVASAFPGSALFNGAEVASDGAGAGLARSGAALVVDGADGAVVAMAADAAFAVNVAAGTRFSASLANLDTDVDLAVVDVSSGSAVLVGASRQQGTSAEAVDADLSDVDRVLVVVVGRVERDPPPAIAGGLAASDRVPFGLTCQLTRGPEIDDVDPIAPAHGPIEGGIPVVVHGRGFFDGDSASVAVRVDGVSAVGRPRVTPAAGGAQTISVVVPPGSLTVSDTAVTVVVENPLDAANIAASADGQAATLAEGFRYDLPSPRLNALAPDTAPTTGGDIDTALSGAFFFDTYGAPVVAVDDVDVDAVFVDGAHLLVRPPPHAAGLASVRVKNRLRDGSLGAPSALRPLFYVTPTLPAPTVSGIDVAEGSADGGTVVIVSGGDFAEGARVFFGADAGIVDSVAADSINVRTPAVDGGGVVDVIVQNSDGPAARLANAFTFVRPPPRITRVFPDRAPTVGSSLVIVDGSGFVAGATASFTSGADVQASPFVDVRSSGELLLRTPATFSAGAATLTLTNPDGQTTSTAFTFFAAVDAPPRLVAVDPQSGDVSGGDAVTLTGSGLQAPVTVLFGNIVIDGLGVTDVANGLQQVRVIAPAGSAGPALVTLINPDGQSTAIAFTYVDVGDPRIVALSPSTVHAQVLGDELLVFGQNLALLGAPVTASAVGAGGARTALGVVAVADTLARVVVDTAVLPTGSFALELRGPNGVALSSTTATARLPNVVSADFDAETGDMLLIGDNLAGERLVRVTVGGLECAGVVADERLIQCALPRAPSQTASLFYAGRAQPVTDTSFTISGVGEGEGEGEVLDILGAEFTDGQRVELFVPGLRASDFAGVQNTVVTFTPLESGTAGEFPVIIDNDDLIVIDDGRALSAGLYAVNLLEARTVRASGDVPVLPLPLINVDKLETAGKGQLVVVGQFPSGSFDVRLTSNGFDFTYSCSLDEGTRMFCFGAPAPRFDTYRVRVFDFDGNLIADDVVNFGGGGQAGCGDGFVDFGEACDDGNASDGDGCDAACQTTPCRGDLLSRRSGLAPDGTCVAVFALPSAWVPAERFCEDAGGHLAAPRTAQRNAFIRALADPQQIWIGVQDFTGEADFNAGAFALVDGGVVGDGFSGFNFGEPNGGFNESCAEMVGGGTSWNDAPCGSIAPQFACEFELQVCGDGVRQTDEACDDGNNGGGDGCDATCGVEVGFACGGRHSQCAPGTVPPTCGNGVVEDDEACDDGNRNDDDGCSAACISNRCDAAGGAVRATTDPVTGQCFGVYAQTLTWFDAEIACENFGGHLASVRDSVTNNLIVAISEPQNDIWLGVQDDTAESFNNPAAWTFVNGGTTGATSFAPFRAGEPNGSTNENCVNSIHGAWNDLVCAEFFPSVEQFACEFDPAGSCGNGVVNPGESCDDKNNNEGDGCDPGCNVEAAFTCSGRPSVCLGNPPPGCGDGFVDPDEACDDGNNANGDGCSRECNTDGCGTTFGARRSSTDPTTNNCIAVFDEVRTWFDAEAVCEGFGGHLLTPRNDITNTLGRSLSDQRECWLGMNDLAVEVFGNDDGFVRVTGGNVADFNRFQGAQPSDQIGDEDCVHYDFGNNRWNDFGCITGEIAQYACEIEPTPCGNGVINAGEGCDDGNFDPNDGCDNSCNVLPGFNCNGRPSSCVQEGPPNCGNGFLNGDEDCDDANDVEGDGCSQQCESSRCGVSLGAIRSLSDPITGNCFMLFDTETSWIDAEARCESIDAHLAGTRDAQTNDLLKAIQDDIRAAWVGVEDFTVSSGDVRSNWTIVGGGTTSDFNGFRDNEPNGGPAENCVFNFRGAWIDADCNLANGITQFACEQRANPCGDGVRQPAEGCDDGNIDDGDGCSSVCTVEAGFNCNGRLSSCLQN